MNREIADRLLNDFFACAEPLNSAEEKIELIADIEERKRYRKTIGEVMGRIICSSSDLI